MSKRNTHSTESSSVDYTESADDLENRIRAHKFFSKTSLETVLTECIESVPEKANILDLGCGSGNYYELFSSKAQCYVGIDISKDLLKEFSGKQKSSVVLINSSMDNFPNFQNGSFDAIFSIYSIYYSSRPIDLIANLHAALSGKGHLFVIGPSQGMHAKEISDFCHTVANGNHKFVKKNTRIENFHSMIVPEILRQFSSVNLEEIDGALHFPSSEEWARYVSSTPQVRECSDLKRHQLLELATEFSKINNCRYISKNITVVTASK